MVVSHLMHSSEDRDLRRASRYDGIEEREVIGQPSEVDG